MNHKIFDEMLLLSLALYVYLYGFSALYVLCTLTNVVGFAIGCFVALSILDMAVLWLQERVR